VKDLKVLVQVAQVKEHTVEAVLDLTNQQHASNQVKAMKMMVEILVQLVMNQANLKKEKQLALNRVKAVKINLKSVMML
jgi:hypothetical protein